MKHIKKMLAGFLTVLLLLNGLSVWATENQETTELPAEVLCYKQIFDNLMMHYKFVPDTETMALHIALAALQKNPEMLEEIVDITADYFDKHTDYMTNEELLAFTTNLNGSYVGIGVTIAHLEKGIEIESVFVGSPAEKAGLKNGDRFIRVDGKDVQNFYIDELQQVILGEEGTTVQITVERDGKLMDFAVVRQAVQQKSVSYTKLDNGLGYMKISVFNGNTPSEIKEADKYFKDRRIRKLIIDLRDNPGGDLYSVVESLGFFVPQGKTVVQLEYTLPQRNISMRSVGDVKLNSGYTLAVLVDGGSASGAELFAGNIRDHKLGKLIGSRTYGKGSMQEIMGLPDTEKVQLGQIKLTTAEYLLPSGDKVHGVGIEPDFRVANRVVALNTDDMETMEFGYNFKEGDSGKGVLALKQRLAVLNYFSGEENETFDGALTLAVKQFQRDSNLPVSGIMDMDTETLLSSVISQAEVLMDDQFERAVEYLTTGK